MNRVTAAAGAIVELWRVDLARWDEADDTLLSPDERRRAAGFLGEKLRRRFVTGRAALRRILAARLDVDPATIAFTYGAQGKPAVAGRGPAFNLSHSGDLMLCAVAERGRLGVDVEAVPRDGPLMEIARRHFSPAELCEIEAAGPAQLRARFAACWTRKEAAIKATGLGVSTPLAAFSVPTEPGSVRCAITVPDREGRAALTLESFEPAPGFVAALAVEGEGWSVAARGPLFPGARLADG